MERILLAVVIIDFICFINYQGNYFELIFSSSFSKPDKSFPSFHSIPNIFLIYYPNNIIISGS